jgi:cation diffusion facilitator family transporter
MESARPATTASGKQQAIVTRRKNATWLSIVSNLTLISGKLSIGLLIGSVSVISEAIHSSVDLVAAVMAFVAVRLAAKPADKSHPYGHGKFENVSGTAEALLIFVGAGLIIYEALQRFGKSGETDAAIWGVAIMGVSAAVNFGVSRYLYKVGRETDSVALQADAAHLSTDVITSLGVFAGLALVWITGQAWLDAATALAVALLIIKAGWDILVQSASGLLDASLPAEEEQAISKVIERFRGRYLDVHELRTRKSGAERHIDFHLVVANHMTVQQAHFLCDEIELALDQEINGAVIQIHVEPESVCTEQDGVYRCSPVHHFHSHTHSESKAVVETYD